MKISDAELAGMLNAWGVKEKKTENVKKVNANWREQFAKQAARKTVKNE